MNIDELTERIFDIASSSPNDKETKERIKSALCEAFILQLDDCLTIIHKAHHKWEKSYSANIRPLGSEVPIIDRLIAMIINYAVDEIVDIKTSIQKESE
jgi:hypothetical protein